MDLPAQIGVVSLNTATNKHTSMERKRYVLNKSRDLIRALVGMMTGIQGPMLVKAFSSAGKTMQKQVDLHQQLLQVKENWEKSQKGTDFDNLEALEDAHERTMEYQTAAEFGEEQTQFFEGAGLWGRDLPGMAEILCLQGWWKRKLLRFGLPIETVVSRREKNVSAPT